jgi:hypothetical protein
MSRKCDKKERKERMGKIDRVREIRAKLNKYVLSVRWLVYRLYRDHGIDISCSGLSHILSGDRVNGDLTEYTINACEQILAAYEEVYNREDA